MKIEKKLENKDIINLIIKKNDNLEIREKAAYEMLQQKKIRKVLEKNIH